MCNSLSPFCSAKEAAMRKREGPTIFISLYENQICKTHELLNARKFINPVINQI
jgi:hypothetical protein